MNKKTGIAVGVAVVIILIIFGGQGLISSMFGGSNNPSTSATTDINTNNTSNTNIQNTPMQQDSSQLQAQDITVGTGDAAVAGKQVTVNYVGTLQDGTKFDSSYDRGQPFTFTLGAGQVIQGWDMGVAGMKVGGKRKLTIPPAFGYGNQAVGPIPANSTLIFQVELLGVK